MEEKMKKTVSILMVVISLIIFSGVSTVSAQTENSKRQDADQQFHLIPNLEKGKIAGLRIFNIQQGSYLQTIVGLKNGDIIKKFNGQIIEKIDVVEELYRIFSQKGKNFTLLVKRYDHDLDDFNEIPIRVDLE